MKAADVAIVKAMLEKGCPQEEISRALGVSRATYFRLKQSIYGMPSVSRKPKLVPVLVNPIDVAQLEEKGLSLTRLGYVVGEAAEDAVKFLHGVVRNEDAQPSTRMNAAKILLKTCTDISVAALQVQAAQEKMKDSRERAEAEAVQLRAFIEAMTSDEEEAAEDTGNVVSINATSTP